MRPASAPAASLALASALLWGLATTAGAQTLDRYGGGGPLPPPAYAPQTYAAQAYSPQAAPVAPAGYAPAAYPTAPYAAAPAAYPGMAVYDRTPSGPRMAAPNLANAGLRSLSWPGKDAAAAALPPAPVAAVRYGSVASGYAPPPAPMPRYVPLPADRGSRSRPFSPAPAPVNGYAPPPTYAFATPPGAARPAPTSIYSDAPGETAPPPQAYAYAPAAAMAPQLPAAPAPAAAGGSRQYSVHAEYGLTPDPAPIPPQFFAATADLSAPETPDAVTPPRTAANATTATAAKAADNAARLSASATP